MKIINDTEIYEPNECYFAVEICPDDRAYTTIYITNKSHYDAEDCLNDNFGDHSLTQDTLDLFEKNEIGNTMEATWDVELSAEKTRKLLIQMGFEENNKLLTNP